MINFPYGMSDFRQIITEDYFYCDRTGVIPLLERGRTQLFMRPRRFGKSLLLSMLENYYDVARKDAFEELFGRLTIGRNPTSLRNRYFILRLDFSCVDPMGTPEDVKRSLYDHINGSILDFAQAYSTLGFNLPHMEIDRANALFSIQSLISSTKAFGLPIYLLIDEYDNFANTIMMLPARDSRARYEALVHDEGLLRTVFKVIKASTSGTGFDRVFITGVSPVVMSDITSGHNIAEDIFLEPEFWDLCGFREEEVEKALHDIASGCGLKEEKARDALLMMRTYYNGYSFVPGGSGLVYNPTLCLYFFKQFQKRCEYPRKMLDANLAVDDAKLEYVAEIPGGRDLILSLVEKGWNLAMQDIADRFGLLDMLSDQSKDRMFIASFLYYFGMLTLGEETPRGEISLKVPNLVIQGLYVDRVRLMMLPDPVTRDEGRLAAEKVYQEGDIAPVCTFVQDRLARKYRDLKLKTFVVASLGFERICFLNSDTFKEGGG